MDRLKSIALLASLGASLAGCNGARYPVEPVSRSVESLNQPVVQRTDYVFDVASTPDGVPSAERQRLDDWFASLRLGYGDRIWVDTSGHTGMARRDIARVAANYGILLSDGAPITPGDLQPGTARVIVSRSVAHVPGCPNWGGPSEAASATSSNYGCATNSNLAAMIADPSDLVLGETDSGNGNAATASKAIKVHREKPPTGTAGLQNVSSKGGN